MSELKKVYLIVDYSLSFALCKGISPYPAVNLRRIGLKFSHKGVERTMRQDHEILYIRTYSTYHGHPLRGEVFQIIDNKKLMIARIKLGF